MPYYILRRAILLVSAKELVACRLKDCQPHLQDRVHVFGILLGFDFDVHRRPAHPQRSLLKPRDFPSRCAKDYRTKYAKAHKT